MGFIQDTHSLLRSWDGTLVVPCENCGCYVRSDAGKVADDEVPAWVRDLGQDAGAIARKLPGEAGDRYE